MENYLVPKLDFQASGKINPFSVSVHQKWGSLVRTKKLYNLAEESERVLHGCDYLRFVLSDEDIELAERLRSFPIFSMYNWVNGSNSSEISIEGYTPFYNDNGWKKHYISVWKITVQKILFGDIGEKFIVSLPYEDIVVPVLEFTFFYWNNAKLKVNHISCMIDFKWKPFRLYYATCWAFEPYEFLRGLLTSDFSENWGYVFASEYKFFELSLTEILASFYCTRYDYRFDFFLPKWHLGLKEYEVFKNIRSKFWKYSSSEYSKKLASCKYWVKDKYWRIYTWWTSWDRSSKYVMARFYQKQVDTWCKWFPSLYAEYMNFTWEVWRLEFEFQSKFCCARGKFNFHEVFIEKQLDLQIREFIGVNDKTACFCQLYYPVSLEFNRLPYSSKRRLFTRYMNDTVKLVDWGINPLDLIEMALNPSQKEKIMTLNSIEKIKDAFSTDMINIKNIDMIQTSVSGVVSMLSDIW